VAQNFDSLVSAHLNGVRTLKPAPLSGVVRKMAKKLPPQVRIEMRVSPSAVRLVIYAAVAVHCSFQVSLATSESGVGASSRAAVFRRNAALRNLGQALFSDPALSASGRQSCASCHNPDRFFAPDNDLAAQQGGADMNMPGTRAVPSLTYRQSTPPFTEHFHEEEEEGDESIDNGPSGGLTWDGRADRLRDQALIPLFARNEMANSDRTKLGQAILARYDEMMTALPGGEGALQIALEALAAYQETPEVFYPYSSKYDFFLAGRAKLSLQEQRGLALFEDPRKGNCAICHVSRRSADGSPPQFTDYGFVALGVPRNRAIAINADPAYFDLGLCGPLRRDLLGRSDYCGLFKTPSLRNVAMRRSFYHNGFVHDLRTAVAFYVERETQPEKWYPRRNDGTNAKYDDLPTRFHANINQEPPFDRKPGEAPALNSSEIDDIVAFLRTLTDGCVPER
jgi:cytochrome c peroxidase